MKFLINRKKEIIVLSAILISLFIVFFITLMNSDVKSWLNSSLYDNTPRKERAPDSCYEGFRIYNKE